jgi:hypothetical protein
VRVRDVVARTGEPKAPFAAPSPAHLAFAGLLGELARLGLDTGHPIARVLERLVPSMLRDVAEIPEDTLRDFCERMAALLVTVAEADETTTLPHLMFVDETGEEEPGDAGAGADLAPLPARQGG